jgi:REP element-mobilizing transposase RayT
MQRSREVTLNVSERPRIFDSVCHNHGAKKPVDLVALDICDDHMMGLFACPRKKDHFRVAAANHVAK